MSLPWATTNARARTRTPRLPSVFPAGVRSCAGPDLQLGTKNSQNPGSLALIKGLLVFVNLSSVPGTEGVRG